MICLSIIIPVYNSERYLERCIKSCISQGFEYNEFEILICDDGSTDRSITIANRLSTEHSCIKVFSQKNAGAGMARNLGIKYAKGRYIIFVDSDDFLIYNSLKYLYEVCETNQLDICRCVLGGQSDEFTQIHKRPIPLKVNKVYNGFQLLESKRVPLDSVCGAFFRNDFLKDNNLMFSNLKTSEDVEFNFHVLLKADRIMYVDYLLYVYYEHSGSRGRPVTTKSIIDFRKNELFIASIIKKTSNSYDNQIKKILISRSNSITFGTIIMLLRMRKIIPHKEVELVLSYAHDLKVYPFKGKTLSWKTTLLAHLFFNRQKLLMRLFDINN